jgi:glycosyltransferase involved in cell wall biosynthesis
MRVLWCARWERDKAPEVFFEAARRLHRSGVPFRLLVAGESFRDAPPVFAEAKRTLGPVIEHWGYAATPEAYRDLLARADVAVSTARHEFFGIAVLEAAAAGAFPLVPRRLAYPETLEAERYPGCFYDGTVDGLAARLQDLAERGAPPTEELRNRVVERFGWDRTARRLDDALDALTGNPVSG